MYLSLLKRTATTLVRNPFLLLPSFFLFVLVSYAAPKLALLQQQLTTTSQVIWFTLGIALILLLLISCCFTFLIALCATVVRKRSWKEIASVVYKRSFSFFCCLCMLILFYNLLQALSFFIAFVLGKTLGLETQGAQSIFYVLYAFCLLVPLLFCSLSTFITVLYPYSPWKSFHKSIQLVKRHYVFMLASFLAAFILTQFMQLLNLFAAELVSTLLITPFIALLFVTLILHHDL